MKRTFTTAALAALTLTIQGASIAHAELLESYTARLSSRDHISSTRTKLTSPAAILRQDRANFHKFRKRDGEDEYDSFFSDSSNRAKMEWLLSNARISSWARQQIVHGAPLVRVRIYDNGIVVEVSRGKGIWN